MSAATVARLEITLDHVEPVVLRRVEVPFNIRLDQLHLTIQAAIGWTNSHLYELRTRGVGWSTPYPDQDWAGDFLDARKARLGDVLEDVGTKTLKYLYDFGDGWEHTIKIERLTTPRTGHPLSALDRSQGPLPARGHWRSLDYAEFLEAFADPKHERHRELKEWFADCRGRRRTRRALVAPTHRQAPPHRLTRGAHRMVTAQSKAAAVLRTTVSRGEAPGKIRYTRIVQADDDGRPMLEQWVLHDAGHAWSGGSPAGSYTEPRGPDASREMMRFFLEHRLLKKCS